MADYSPDQIGYRILIVGCGDLGSRHLQSISLMKGVHSVEIVDPSPEALTVGKRRLTETPSSVQSIKYKWLTSIEDATFSGDLCIVATQAEGRSALVQKITESTGYSKFILEKMVSNSVDEFDALLRYSNNNELSVWVNCKSRGYLIHQRIKHLLDPEEPVEFSVVGGNHGLASGGIHLADLFAFYDGSDEITGSGLQIDPILHPSKRGKELFDLSGVMFGHTVKGGRFYMSYASDHSNWAHLTVATRQYRCVVDHLQRYAYESSETTDWDWRPVRFNGPMLVSEMTKGFAEEILTTGTCALPTLQESRVAHQYILSQLKPHFQNLMGHQIDSCPVT